MSNDKALAIIPRTVDEVTDLADRFSKSALIPVDLRNKVADVFVTLLAGQELGLAPMASLRSIHVVKGRAILSADAMVGLVLASGLCEYFRATAKTTTAVSYETKRKGSEPVALTWTIEDAQRASLAGGDNWRKYPRAMLSARCKAELARDVYPDVLAGVYEDSEAAEFDGASIPAVAVVTERTVSRAAPVVPDVIDAEIVPEYDLDGALTALREVETLEDLRQLGATFKGAPASVRDRITAAYRQRGEELRAAKPVESAA